MRSKSWNIAVAWAGGAAVAWILIDAALRQGMYFEADIYPVEILLLALAALVGIGGAILGWRRRQRIIPGWALLPFAIGAAYGLHLLLDPVSWKGTMDSFLRWTAYGSWTVLLAVYLSAARNRQAAWIALQATFSVLILGSWIGWFGWIDVDGLVFRSDQAALAATGARLAGFLQYPNAFGAVAAFIVVIEWQLQTSSHRRISRTASLLLVPSLAALLLTESRGATLALLGAFLLGLLFGGRMKLGYGLATAGISLGLASLAASTAFQTMRSGEPGNGIWMLAGAACLGALLLEALRREAERYWHSFDSSGRVRLVPRNKRFSLASPLWGAILLALGCAAAYLLLAQGETGGARLDGHYETASARQLYYADALRMFNDRPWVGAGGESWRMLVGQYKSVPYIGNEVHSGYLEILIDTGLVGILLLLGMLFYFLFKLRVRPSAAWPPAALLLAHSAVDFDWAFGFVWLLLLFWFALQMRESEEAKTIRTDEEAGGPSLKKDENSYSPLNTEPDPDPSNASPRSDPPRPFSNKGSASQPGSSGRKVRGASALIAALLLVAAAAALPAAWRSLDAASEAGLRAALASNPAWSRVRLELAPLLSAQERVELLARGLRYDPQYPALEFQLGMAYAELAEPAAAAAHLREALRLDRFDREAQNAAIARMAVMAERYAAAGSTDRSAVAADAAIDMFEGYRELYRTTYKGKSNPWDDKDQALFSSAKYNAASAMLLRGRQEEAAQLLREVESESSEEWSRLAREKLAALNR